MKILQTTDLKKYYGTEPNITRALDGVNFSVEEGEFVAVIGTSGSGKSTLLHMMGGLDTPTSGSVMVRDKELGLAGRGGKLGDIETMRKDCRDGVERVGVSEYSTYGNAKIRGHFQTGFSCVLPIMDSVNEKEANT